MSRTTVSPCGCAAASSQGGHNPHAMASTPETSQLRLAWEGPVCWARPGQRPSFLLAVGSYSMYMCNYSAASNISFIPSPRGADLAVGLSDFDMIMFLGKDQPQSEEKRHTHPEIKSPPGSTSSTSIPQSVTVRRTKRGQGGNSMPLRSGSLDVVMPASSERDPSPSCTATGGAFAANGAATVATRANTFATPRAEPRMMVGKSCHGC